LNYISFRPFRKGRGGPFATRIATDRYRLLVYGRARRGVNLGRRVFRHAGHHIAGEVRRVASA
jgi:hypothetical protein